MQTFLTKVVHLRNTDWKRKSVQNADRKWLFTYGTHSRSCSSYTRHGVEGHLISEVPVHDVKCDTEERQEECALTNLMATVCELRRFVPAFRVSVQALTG